MYLTKLLNITSRCTLICSLDKVEKTSSELEVFISIECDLGLKFMSANIICMTFWWRTVKHTKLSHLPPSPTHPSTQLPPPHTHPHTHLHTTQTYLFLEETVSVLAGFQWTHFPAAIHHIRTRQYTCSNNTDTGTVLHYVMWHIKVTLYPHCWSVLNYPSVHT